MKKLNLNGMVLAPGVVETIASVAVKDVPGVVEIASSIPSTNTLKKYLGVKQTTQRGIDATVDEQGALRIAIRLVVKYGYVLPNIAADVRDAVVDAVTTQIGVPVGAVDVYIDAIEFGE